MNRLQLTTTENRQPSSKKGSIYDDGYLRVEHENYYVTIGGRRLKLSRAEFRLISILTQDKERYVPAEIIWRHLWDKSKPLNANSLRVFICGIRRQLDPFGIRVEALMNVGYRLFSPKSSG